MVCWIAGGAGFFLFSVLPGGAVEPPGRSRPAPGVVDLRRGGSMSSSLSRFSGWRSRSLSLGEGLTDSTGARDGTRAAWCVGSRAAPAFFFLVFCLAAPSSHRVDRGRHLASSTFAGGSMSSSLSRFSGWRSRSLSLGEGLPDSTGARDGTRAAWCVGSRAAPAFFFLVFCLAAPSSYRVDRGRHLALSTFAGVAQCRALSPDFPAARSRSLSLGEGLPDSTGARDGTRAAWCVGSRAAPAFFFLVFCLAAPSSYRVDRGRHLALSTFAGGLNVELSLPIFRLPRSRSLSLGEGLTDSTGARDGTRAAWCVGSRAAPAFFFLVFCLAAPSSYRVDRGRHLASSTFAGVLNVELSLPIFRLPRSRSLSLGEGLPDSTGARDGTRAAWCVGSRAAPAFFVLVFCLAAPSSHRVDRGRHLALSTFAGVLNVELSLPIFRLPRSRSLSLGEGLPDSTGARDGTRAAGVLDRGRRRLFSF